MTATAPYKIMLIAGEPSGDLLGAGLMTVLPDQLDRDISFSGIGGPRMAAAGLESLFPMSDLSVMGFVEILPKLFPLLRRIRQTRQAVLETRPDVLITIDSPGFCFRIAKIVRPAGIRVMHYTAPQVWAWRQGRAGHLHRYMDHLLTLFDFEPAFFTAHDLPCTFVGHPVITRISSRRREADAEGFCRDYGVEPSHRKLLLLPGSRGGEVARLLPAFRGAYKKLLERYPDMTAIVSSFGGLADTIRSSVRDWPGRVVVAAEPARHGDAFAAADVALTASGTASLELVLSEVPTVVAYRTNPVTAFVARRMILTDFVSLPNIILKRRAVPELLQENCTPDRLAEEAVKLLEDRAAISAQKEASVKLHDRLGGKLTDPPSVLAARAVKRFLTEEKASE